MKDRNRDEYDIYLILRSVTLAQRARAQLESGGILSRLQRSPGELSEHGCAYALRIRNRELPGAARILRQTGMEPDAAFRALPGGGFERIAV